MSSLTGRLFSAILVLSILFAVANLATPTHELRLLQQTTYTATMNGETFGCNGGTCSLVGVQTNTVTGLTTTYIVGGSTVTFVQEGSTWTASLFLTLTQNTQGQESIVSQYPNPLIIVGVVALAALVLAVLLRSKTTTDEFKPPDVDDRVLEYLKSHNGEISMRAASQSLGLSEMQVKESISRLSNKGAIVRDQRACPFCGNVNPPFAEHFCVKCGKPLSNRV